MSSSDLKAMPKMFFACTHKRETCVEENEEEANRLQIKVLKIWGRFQLVSSTILTRRKGFKLLPGNSLLWVRLSK